MKDRRGGWVGGWVDGWIAPPQDCIKLNSDMNSYFDCRIYHPKAYIILLLRSRNLFLNLYIFIKFDN